MGVCNCSMFCCMLLYVHSSIVIILMGKRELVALLNLSSWCLVMVARLFLAVPWGCLRFVIVVFPDHTHLLIWVTVRLWWNLGCAPQICIKLKSVICWMPNDSLCLACEMQVKVRIIVFLGILGFLGVNSASSARHRWS